MGAINEGKKKERKKRRILQRNRGTSSYFYVRDIREERWSSFRFPIFRCSRFNYRNRFFRRDGRLPVTITSISSENCSIVSERIILQIGRIIEWFLFIVKERERERKKEKKKNNLVFFNVNNTFPFSLFPRFNLSFRLFN